MYLDLAKPVWRAVARQLTSVADVAISIDGIGASLVDPSASGVPWRELWSPIAPPDLGPIERDIDVSMIGSVSTSPRREYLAYLRDHGIEVVTGGGYETSYGLSIEEYYRYLYRSKIVLNIARAGNQNFAPDGSPILYMKGRVMEALACGALLLEMRNDVTAKYFEDGADYVSYADLGDLVRKIGLMLADEDRRLAIARHGHRTFTERYTARIFWERLFAEVAAARHRPVAGGTYQPSRM
jgi:glycosyltransferase involved in cell wall biosynthesis